MRDDGKRNILGVHVSVIDYERAVDAVLKAARAGEPLSVSALAVHGVMTGVLDAAHRGRLNGLDVVVPDGQPVRWTLNLLHGAGLVRRVYGPNLMLQLCERASLERLPVFFYGSRPEVLDRLQANLLARFPGLIIAGVQPSRFRTVTPAEKQDIVRFIRDSGAAMTFVGLGCPRQEVWAYENRDELRMPVLAVGAAFDFHAGTAAQAPLVLQEHGLEWLFRLGQEPRRLWKRYLYLNPLYVALVALQGLRIMKFDEFDFQTPGTNVNVG